MASVNSSQDQGPLSFPPSRCLIIPIEMNPAALGLKTPVPLQTVYGRHRPLLHPSIIGLSSVSCRSWSSNFNCAKVDRTLLERRILAKAADSFEPEPIVEDKFVLSQAVHRNETRLLEILKGANSIIPHIVLGSTVLALIYPPSFTWFTNRYYAPALGFLMFAVGVNSSPKDFAEAFKKPDAIAAGYVGQYIIKPLLGYLFGIIAVSIFNLPNPLGAGIMLVSCVSGAQLSNYATFLTDPPMAPLSIVMTSLSTATAVLVTPTLSLLLIGQKLPVDVKGMMSSIMQIVVAPIAAGLLLNRFLPRICSAIQPFLPPLSVFVTALCVGSPLAINMKAIISPFGVSLVLLLFAFHASAFVAGYGLAGMLFHRSEDVQSLQRTISFQTGMQSSLLALALANKFFKDPLVGVPPAISVVLMSLMGFALVMIWSKRKQQHLNLDSALDVE